MSSPEPGHTHPPTEAAAHPARTGRRRSALSAAVQAGAVLCSAGAVLLGVQFIGRPGWIEAPPHMVWPVLIAGIGNLAAVCLRVGRRSGMARAVTGTAEGVSSSERWTIRVSAVLVAAASGWAAVWVVPGAAPWGSALTSLAHSWPWYTHALWIACVMLLIGGVLLAVPGRRAPARRPARGWAASALGGDALLLAAGERAAAAAPVA
ncbi:hypothetical protein [Nocardiopsis coralliicola]